MIPSGIHEEYSGLSLGDERLNKRARAIVGRGVASPSESFPRLLPTSGELEGAYRFFQNELVEPEKLLAPHRAATIARMKGESVVRVAHDTVTLSYLGEREGLGVVGGGGSGYYAQVALAIGGDEDRVPLGVVGLETKAYPTREEREKEHLRRARAVKGSKDRGVEKAAAIWSGVDKWSTIPVALRNQTKGTRVVHVMDREADNYEVLAELMKHRLHFVIRGGAERRIRPTRDGHQRVEDELAGGEILLTRRVKLAARPKTKGVHPQREEREANLSVRAARVTLQPTKRGLKPSQMTLNVVEVVELHPPADEEAVNWVLLTTEPAGSADEVAAVVDHYSARWRIEEFFKALKTGCSIEKRQMTDYESLTRVLALFIPIAWHLLLLRSLARAHPSPPAASILAPVSLTVLRALAAQRKHTLNENPTVHDALLAIAALGGHLKRNGAPGWLTIGRGYDELLSATAVWILATQAAPRSKQS